MVSGIHEKVVKSDIALPWPRSLLLGPLRRLPMLMPHGGGEGRVQRGKPAWLTRKAAPVEGGQVAAWVRTLPEKLDKYLSTLLL